MLRAIVHSLPARHPCAAGRGGRPFDGLQPDVVIVESIWPNAAFEEGLGINTLVSADPGAPRGGAVFHDTAVWLRPA